VTTILYFAWVREAVGAGEEEVSIPATIATLSQLIDWLSEKSARHAAALADRDRLRFAVDQRFVGLDHPVAMAREIAVFPPVTGG
jgi:sulfur-carrier protein